MLSAASCGEASILKRNKPFHFRSLTPRQAAGNALADGFNNFIYDDFVKSPDAVLRFPRIALMDELAVTDDIILHFFQAYFYT